MLFFKLLVRFSKILTLLFGLLFAVLVQAESQLNLSIGADYIATYGKVDDADYFDTQTHGELHQSIDKSIDMLTFGNEEVGNLVDMLVIKAPLNLSLQQARQACPMPLQKKRLEGNQLIWSCRNWSLLVTDDKINEVWLIANY